jgi:hypothetical protein
MKKKLCVKLVIYKDVFYSCLSEVFTVVKIRMYCGFMGYGTLQSGMWAILVVFLQVIQTELLQKNIISADQKLTNICHNSYDLVLQ